MLCGMWDLPRPGPELVAPTLAGRFSTTAAPGRPYAFVIWRRKTFSLQVRFTGYIHSIGFHFYAVSQLEPNFHLGEFD